MREYPRRRASPCLTQHRVRRLSNRPPDQGIPGDHRPRSTQHPADPRDLAAWRCHFPKSSPLGFRASFEVSFASLPGRDNPDGVDPAQAFRLLGLWQGPSIGLPAAAALLGQPESAVADALEVLVDAHLLDSPEPDAYRFHDLLRVYAADLAPGAGDRAGPPGCGHSRARLVPAHRRGGGRVISPQHTRVPLDPAPPELRPLDFSKLDEALNWCEAEPARMVAAARPVGQDTFLAARAPADEEDRRAGACFGEDFLWALLATKAGAAMAGVGAV